MGDYQDENEIAVKLFIRRMKEINEVIREKEKNFDGEHCIFCGEKITPKERITECRKYYCKKCSDKLFRF